MSERPQDAEDYGEYRAGHEVDPEFHVMFIHYLSSLKSKKSRWTLSESLLAKPELSGTGWHGLTPPKCFHSPPGTQASQMVFTLQILVHGSHIIFTTRAGLNRILSMGKYWYWLSRALFQVRARVFGI